MSFTVYPSLQFNDAYAQPSDQVNGRRLVVTFDTTNIYVRTVDDYFTDNTLLPSVPVIVQIQGTTLESPLYENFSFNRSGDSVTGSLHFTSFTGVSIIQGNKIFLGSSFGAVGVKEYLPLSAFDGYEQSFLQVSAYGSGVFLFADAYGDAYNPGFGEYEFEYASPLQIGLNTAPETIFIGNNAELNNAANGIMDEVKITSATATKTRTRELAGSYDVSIEATSPIFSEPDAKTLVLLHLDNNTNMLIDALRDPLDSANLTDSVLATIISLKNNRARFINYVDSLNISGSIVEESLDTRPLSWQLFDLVSALNKMVNSAKYYKLSGKYMPSEIIVNNNFSFAAVFSGNEYFIEKPGLIHNNQGSIELWIAPLFNILGDLKRRIYLDAINHAIIGASGNFTSVNANLIKLPNNIIAQHINSIHIYNDIGVTNEFDFSEFSALSGDGTTITLSEPLPFNSTRVIVDYVPLSASNDRLTLFKDEDSNLVFSISANGTLYHISHDISDWQKNEWHRVMITWKANDKNNLDHINMYVDGTQSTIIKYGQGFLFNTFKFKQEQQININTKIIPQNIQFIGTIDKLYIGSSFSNTQAGMCRLSNIRVSFIERLPVIDARGFKIDFDFDGGSKSATPSIQDAFTSYLEDFDPSAGYVEHFATAQNASAGAHDLRVIVRDNFNLVRGVGNGQTERLLRELIKIIKPAEARARISVITND